MVLIVAFVRWVLSGGSTLFTRFRTSYIISVPRLTDKIVASVSSN